MKTIAFPGPHDVSTSTSSIAPPLAIDLDLGASWTESSGAFALAPATLDLGNLAKAQARFGLANVPRNLFTTDPVQAMGQAAQVETGTFELSLRGSGVIDLVVAQFARMQDVSRDDARGAIVAMIRAQGEKITGANGDVKMAVDALAGFVETSRQTLTVKLTPRAEVPLMQLMQLSQSAPRGRTGAVLDRGVDGLVALVSRMRCGTP